MRPGTRTALLAYLVLLAASKTVRLAHPFDGELRQGERTIALHPPGRDRSGSTVRLAFLDSDPSNRDARPVVVLLHGSPGDNREVLALGTLLEDHYRVIAPDLPGFGGSSRRLPDYSFRAHAGYVLQLLDRLHVPRVHVVGFSMGGGVALSLIDLDSARVTSLTMLSAIGAQEYELLGDYTLNHALHGLQLAGLWLLREGTPHFGWLDDAGLDVPYARNFFDSDQRPLRGILSRWAGPTLILHGESDPLVAPAAAREHHRLVPQSELVMFPGNHFMAFAEPELLSRPLLAFLSRVDAGTATTRATADPARLALAQVPFDPASLPPISGLASIILLLLLAASTLVSEDAACIAAGLLVAHGTIALWPGTLACLAGIFLGDLLLFLAGRWSGHSVARRPPLTWLIDEAGLHARAARLERRGPMALLASRMAPGQRLSTDLAAGIVRFNPLQFSALVLLTAVVRTAFLAGAALLLGRGLSRLAVRPMSTPALLLLAVGLALAIRLVISLSSFRGRRLWLSRWRRLTRWEFWPMWAFYPPIIAYIVWLSIRHRGLTLISAVNPGIPGGGIAGESKFAILSALQRGSERVAPGILLEEGTTVASKVIGAERFMRQQGADFPVVLKPDIGERGSGVAIVRSVAELRSYLESAQGDVIAQRYIPGLEFGVFYYRIPGQPTGKIFAITEKRMPAVTGDGHRDLQTLILSDDRAVCMAPFHLSRHANHLDLVPAAGEVISLVELGTHCRGAAFYDGGGHRTEALERSVDEVSKGFPGFWFGRYDVRTPSVEDFEAGRFSVLELNGATSEATSIYDPSTRLLDAYRILGAQWRLLFQIAALNRAAGARVASLGEILAMLRRHRTELGRHVAPPPLNSNDRRTK